MAFTKKILENITENVDRIMAKAQGLHRPIHPKITKGVVKLQSELSWLKEAYAQTEASIALGDEEEAEKKVLLQEADEECRELLKKQILNLEDIAKNSELTTTGELKAVIEMLNQKMLEWEKSAKTTTPPNLASVARPVSLSQKRTAVALSQASVQPTRALIAGSVLPSVKQRPTQVLTDEAARIDYVKQELTKSGFNQKTPGMKRVFFDKFIKTILENDELRGLAVKYIGMDIIEDAMRTTNIDMIKNQSDRDALVQRFKDSAAGLGTQKQTAAVKPKASHFHIKPAPQPSAVASKLSAPARTSSLPQVDLFENRTSQVQRKKERFTPTSDESTKDPFIPLRNGQEAQQQLSHLSDTWEKIVKMLQEKYPNTVEVDEHERIITVRRSTIIEEVRKDHHLEFRTVNQDLKRGFSEMAQAFIDCAQITGDWVCTLKGFKADEAVLMLQALLENKSPNNQVKPNMDKTLEEEMGALDPGLMVRYRAAQAKVPPEPREGVAAPSPTR